MCCKNNFNRDIVLELYYVFLIRETGDNIGNFLNISSVTVQFQFLDSIEVREGGLGLLIPVRQRVTF
jgi:hypothetical protein